jgi:hypothetical protein
VKLTNKSDHGGALPAHRLPGDRGCKIEYLRKSATKFGNLRLLDAACVLAAEDEGALDWRLGRGPCQVSRGLTCSPPELREMPVPDPGPGQILDRRQAGMLSRSPPQSDEDKGGRGRTEAMR